MTSHAHRYRQYIERVCPEAEPALRSRIDEIDAATCWENPMSAVDWNNIAVLALIEAEQSSDPARRRACVESAIESLYSGHKQRRHSVCDAHIALVHCLLGDADQAIDLALQAFAGSLQPCREASSKPGAALVYLPSAWARRGGRGGDELATLLRAADGLSQQRLLLSTLLCRAPLAFYNAAGMRFLELAGHLWPDSAPVCLRLGLACLLNNRLEGLWYLHRAVELAPESPLGLQALYIAYRGLDARDEAGYWLERGRAACRRPDAPEWRWVAEPAGSDVTYVALEAALALAVEPSWRSIVTSVLLAEGDWFEPEMELWRARIEPGMTVVDVGANAGVYTFSAAARVGRHGRVVAVEPFSRCVRYLNETVRANQLPQVTVCAGAASDREGTARLGLQSASELNALVPDAAATPAAGTFETVRCVTLDELCRGESLRRVDFLKIDAEGHELAVLSGAARLLNEFAPAIIYENMVGERSGDVDVSIHLQGLGYQLFRYQPFLKELAPAGTIADRQGALNIVAIPSGKVHQFKNEIRFEDRP